MTHPDLERRVTDLFADEAPQRAPDWLLHDALAAIDSTPQQRPRVRMAWRFRPMHDSARAAVAAVAVVAVAVVGLAVLRPEQGPGVVESPGPSESAEPSPSPSQSAQPSAEPSHIPSPSPTSRPEPLESSPPSARSGVAALPTSGMLAPGRYTTGDTFAQPIEFDVSDGWESCGEGPLELEVCGSGSLIAPGVTFMVAENVVANPCSDAQLDPAVGPSVDDLVAAISSLEGFTATAATDVSISGYVGKQFEVTAPTSGECFLTWATAERINGVGAGEINVIRILDVEGQRLMFAGAFDGSQAGRSSVEQILDSVSIGP